ncbi:GvpL/GvpF family gas vesicle protein [Geodermatophilus ruber]|uniref:Gas vesicle synthesis protein GvpL/GvpF n=1 Tax=Geodermatophilus ruber TaxID=504800 RepID=A0A1I4GRN6_9ACTN|nr:GvpL/GvpF family gas vesicle protein [Geodermatophilus ruber]SFL32160.1 Gas vesicle synthesis protein GvpL/GvpF [Geodermatophilus ruber]
MTGPRRDDALDGLVRALGDAAAPAVLRRALDDARRRAAEQLTDRLATAILTAVGRLPTSEVLGGAARGAPSPPAPDPGSPTAPPEAPAPGPRTAPPGTASPEAAGPDRCLYAYAITPAGPLDLAEVAGVDDRSTVTLVESGDLALVVSDVPATVLADVSEDDVSETGALARLARRHDAVVRAVADRAPVLPLRFGTAVADRDAAVRLLAETGPGTRARLDRVAGHREWGVRLRRTDPEPPPAEPAGPMNGTEYLRQRSRELEDADRRRHARRVAADDVHRQLSRHATDAITRSGASDLVDLDTAYLVPLDADAAFTAAADRLAGELAPAGLELTTTGPWPPYSFAELAEEVVHDRA